ncbi:Interferon-induced protein 44-like [Trebouxia sp. C0009 RCD-2024]
MSPAMRQVTGSKLVASVETLAALARLLKVRRNTLNLRRLFDAGESGWNNVSAFQSACNDQGPTIVLIRSSDGRFYGGYTSVSWDTSKSYRPDSQAFLFRLYPEAGPGSNRHVRSEQFYVSPSEQHRAQHSSSCGPTFGAGNDLMTFTTSGISLRTNPSSYPTLGPLIDSSVSRTEGNFQLEVLQVTIDHDAACELELSWVEGVHWGVQDSMRLQKEVLNFTPAAAGVPIKSINLLLCGGVGAGKSSIVSTIDSLCLGRISRRAPHGQGTGSLTRKLRKYTFVNPDSMGKSKVQWQVWDSMGWGASDYQKGELGFILDGHLPDKCKLDDPISLRTSGFKAEPGVADAVHCMCLVVPCDAASDDSYMARLRDMRQFARDREIPTLVFLTKIDNYDPDVIGQDLSKTFHRATRQLRCGRE